MDETRLDAFGRALCADDDHHFSPGGLPQMISAAFIWEPGTYDAEFNELNALIEQAAISTPGFVGVESWTSEDGKRNNATYYWRSLESLKLLSEHPTHIEAKRRYAEWYNGYHVVISEVIRTYGDGAFAHVTPAGKSAD